MSTSRAPKIIWVIGSGTDVGKTTIATAFIRAMNRRHAPTVGFKPCAVSMLKNTIDFLLEKFPNSKYSFFGSDAWELSMASPLTRSEFVDTVAPLQFLCHPTWESNLLARTGAVATDDVEYFRSNYAASIQARPDIVELARRTGLPICEAKIVDPLTLLELPPLTPQKQQRAFNRLVALGAEVVVCEGGGPLLPVWPGCPYPDDVVVLLDGIVYFFPNLGVRFFPNISVKFDANAGASLNSKSHFLKLLKSTRAKYFSSALYMVESQRRREIADQIAESLISAAGDKIS